jgi:transposase
MDVPNRIAKSTAAGAPFGLTPKKYQSGEKDVTGVTRASAENGMITMAAPPMSLRGHSRRSQSSRAAQFCPLLIR